MKSLLPCLAFYFAVSLSLSASAATRTVDFTCEAADFTTMNRFSGSGTVDVNGGKGTGDFSGEMVLSGKNSTSVNIDEMNVKGDAKIIPAGQYTVNELIVLQLASDNGGKKYHMTFNLGLGGDWGSMLFVDGVVYKARCFEIK
jgi:hypothetical protein